MPHKILVALQHATYGGVYYAVDFDYGGAQPTWNRLSTSGLANLLLDQLQTDPADPFNTFYVLLQNGNVYKWNGSGFALIMTITMARALTGEAGGVGEALSGISTDPTMPGRIYAVYIGEVSLGSSAFILKSENYGGSWIVSTVTDCCQGVAGIVRVRGNHIWVGGSDANGSLFYSNDAGTTWNRDAEWISSANSLDPKINPDSPGTVYVNRNKIPGDFNDLGKVVYSAGFTSTLLQSDTANCWYINEVRDGSGSDVMWIDPDDSNHARIIGPGSAIGTTLAIYTSNDTFNTMNSPSNIVLSPNPGNGMGGCLVSPPLDDGLIAFSTIVGRIGPTEYPLVWALNGENAITASNRSGENWNVAPYTNSIPSLTGSTVYVVRDGIWLGEPVATPCFIATATSYATTSNYQIRLKDQTGTTVAIFDNWESLNFTKTVNEVGSYDLTFVDDGSDTRFDLFELDGTVEVWRRIPGSSVAWYVEFRGLHRKSERTTDQDGSSVFISTGYDYNDLLSRTQIAWLAGTIEADKSDVAEDVIKEYVYENCGAGALYVDGRERDGVLPGFSVDASGGAGNIWEGSRSFENLMDVLQDISNQTNIDFNVEWNGDAQYVFRTYVNQLGIDRTTIGLDPVTGKNAAGNDAVIFNILLGNIQSITYTNDRTTEANIVFVLGAGDGATRDVIVREDASAIDDSPWNRREINRPGGNQEFTFQLEELGDEVLKEMQAKDVFEFSPLQQSSSLYGSHYFLGDRCTVNHRNTEKHIRITQVSVAVANKEENISITMSVIPQHKK